MIGKIINWFIHGPALPFKVFEGVNGLGLLFLIGCIVFFIGITFVKKWRDIFF